MQYDKSVHISNTRPLIGSATTAIDPDSESWPGAGAPGQDGWIRARLTPRQLDVFALLCEGLSNKLIGQRLNVSLGTVKVHISHILRELGVSNRLQAVISAYNVSAAKGDGSK